MGLAPKEVWPNEVALAHERWPNEVGWSNELLGEGGLSALAIRASFGGQGGSNLMVVSAKALGDFEAHYSRFTWVGAVDGARWRRADIEVPNHPVDVSSWERLACYP
ncbi:hypothetical protein E3N88_44108 [Mikania micrantha]|uniref:Uncharacterized protein n=1 Tax=Mikania micrantha TaxID=192012 RepID=A0A5N6LD04_9ASTR|nr:hypothetical protein E3N88_44108 [Mikania micrantha]